MNDIHKNYLWKLLEGNTYYKMSLKMITKYLYFELKSFQSFQVL